MDAAFLAFCLCLAAPSASEEQQLLFYASYDKAFDADSARGDAKGAVLPNPKSPEPPHTVPGVLGNAVHANRRGLKYEAKGNLDSCQGTIIFWFQPVNWSGEDDLMHHLFGTQMKPRCHMLIYRYMRTKKKIGGIFGKFAFYLRGGSPDDPKHSLVIPCTRVSDSWKPGEWRHVAATWGKRQARLYVDGTLVGQGAGKLPGVQPAFFTVSANGGGGTAGVANVIDELRIYGRVLELPEITRHYVRGKRALAQRLAMGAPLPPAAELARLIKVGCAFQDGLTKLLVRVDVTNLPVADLSGLRVGLSVKAQNGAVVGLAEGVEISEFATAIATLDVSKLPPGKHRLEGRVHDAKANRKIATWSKVLERPDAPWLGNDIGKSDEPCAPFEAVRVDGSKVNVWGKHYDVADAFLLRQAAVRPDPRAALHKSAKRFWRVAPLLAAPVRLVAVVDGRELRLDAAEVKLSTSAKTHAIFEAVTHRGNAKATSTLRFDDDSIVTADVALDFGATAHVLDLRIEIPIKTEYCRWMNWTSMAGHRDASGAGAIPAGEGVLWKGVFHPLLWLGDDYRGFGYFCDNSRGWTGDLTAPDRVLIRREGDVTTIVLRMAPQARLDTWRTKISFIATPARPLPRHWRGMSLNGNFRVRPIPYIEGCPMHVVYWWTTAFFEQKQNHFSSPRTDTLRVNAIKEAIAASGDKPTSHMFYTYPNSYHHPVVPSFYSDWCNKSTEDMVSMLGQRDMPISTRVDWNSSVRDWWLWQMSQLADIGVDGIYCDDPYTHPSFNHRTGAAFVGDDGKVRGSYGLYGLREYFRRLRMMLNQKANYPHMILHMSNQLTLPFQIYFDSFANGEHMNCRLKEHYIGKLSTDEIRAQYLGYQWGNIPVILPELGGKFRKSVAATEEMLSLMLPHDVLIWVAWCDAKTARAYNAALQEEFKTWADDCSFLPYWEARDIIRGQDDRLVASAYVRDESVLLIVSNWSDAPRHAQLRIDWDALTGGKAMQGARVLLGKGEAQLGHGVLSVAVPPRNLRVVMCER